MGNKLVNDFGSSSEHYWFIKCILKDSVQNAKTGKIEKIYDHDVNSYRAILSDW